MTPRPGDFGLVGVNGTAGRLIRVGQWLNGDGFRDYEHAFLVLDDNELVEAEPGGARLRSLDDYAAAGVVYSSWPLDDPQRAAIVAAGRDMLGTPYSALDYLAIALHRFHIPAPGLRSYIATSHHTICSQLVDACYMFAGVQLFADGRWPGWVTPASLLQALGGPVITTQH